MALASSCWMLQSKVSERCSSDSGIAINGSERLRPAVLNVRPLDVIFVKQNGVELPLIDHFPALAAFVE